ncbi:ferrous iron transport protein A [Hassallia byssoidea VB512170]|uniref:Ferrous iron transport protein A n=1 Tax=Hassallia byssoidea VB512170 TaxID=1304833 RepID=A0A846H6G9_9CYAN|nr:FeoA family protein [Hassalia byssoidea]NEU72189.1 ferrous iron transport protein A [Hassalia byssoidea VB512170]
MFILLREGEQGIVTFCNNQDEIILKKLISMEVVPGTIITLEEKLPSFAIKVGNRRWQIDKEVACAIYVRVANSG